MKKGWVQRIWVPTFSVFEKLVQFFWFAFLFSVSNRTRPILCFAYCEGRHQVWRTDGYLEFYGVWRVNGDLAVSRAIGDQHLKPFVSAEPEVSTYKIQPEDQCLILATDGLWDEISSQEAVNQVVKSENYYSQALHSLLQDADSFQDNTSIILVNLISDLV